MMGHTFVVGDTHGFGSDFRKVKTWSKANKKELTKDDVLIQLGDAGWIWYAPGTNKEQEYWLNWLATRNFTLLVVLGNHENYDSVEEFPECEMFGGTVQYYESTERFGTGRVYFAKRGEVYNINGKSFWAFGGALSCDKGLRTVGVDFWDGEQPTWNEFEYGMTQLDKVDWKVDYVITHTCPVNIIGDVIHTTVYTEGKFKDPVAEYLYEVYKKIEFSEWFAGHFHTDVTLDYSSTGDGIFHFCYNNLPKEI